MTLPQDILDRVARVLKYHRASKLPPSNPAFAAKADSAARPSTRVFSQAPKVALATTLMDASTPAIHVLKNGRDALPDSQLNPPQDLKTLSTWLFMADGMIPIRRQNQIIGYERTCPSSAGTAPCEIYVAAFAIEGLEPGLYHFSPREYALRKLRDGHEALALLKRGRPDLDFLKTTPAVMLVSTVFARSSFQFGERAYRAAVCDAGHLMENISICGQALGIQTITRMRANESTSHELIGVAPDAAFDDAESVQAMIIWADPATTPMPPPTSSAVVEHLAPIARPPQAKPAQRFPDVLAVHHDCVAPGMAIREIRPPITELTPMPADAALVRKHGSDDPPTVHSIFRALTSRRAAADFHRRSIGRDAFLAMNAAAFRGGSHFPLFPDGPQVALVRPFWSIQSVTGIDGGLWYYHPPADKWVCLDSDDHRIDLAYLAHERPLAANASAVCMMFANLPILMSHAGPDAYRLAHLEAGMTAQRLYLAANSLGLACTPMTDFYDDELRKFLGMDRTGWEPIHMCAVGVSIDDKVPAAAVDELGEDDADLLTDDDLTEDDLSEDDLVED